MTELNGVPLAGVVLTGSSASASSRPGESILDLCDKTLKETGLPVMSFDSDSYVFAATVSVIDWEVPMDNIQRIEKVMDKIASNLDVDAFCEGLSTDSSPAPNGGALLEPRAYRHPPLCINF